MEQGGLWKQIDPALAWDSEMNRVAAETAVKSYQCAAQALADPQGARNLTTYAGIAGAGASAAALPLGDKRCGFFGYDRRICFNDVADGTSRTMLVADTSVRLGPWAQGGFATVRGLDFADTPYIHEDGPFGRVHRERRRFASIAPTLMAGMGDGSVREISNKISEATFEALVTIAGDEPLGNDW